jgi:glycosyltransferase involved in cell wall biosynthesis
MIISVLICTYNRGNLIHNTLKSLIEGQELAPDEIIVVNGGGENDCSATIAYWQSRFPALNHIHTENLNLAKSRNIGLRHCKGELVLQTDDDARPFPDWVKNIKEAHKIYPDAGVIGGEVIDASGKGVLNEVADVLTFPWYPKVCEVRSVPGVNSSYKKYLIEQVGEYDTRLFRGEDVDYNWRAIQSGWKVLYVPGIKVYHNHRSTWRGLLNQHYMYGKAYFLVRKKWQNMYAVYPRNLKSARDLFKAIYFIFSPAYNSFVKLKKVRGFFRKLVLLIPLTAVGYAWMCGVIIQFLNTDKSHPVPLAKNISVE